jgi:uncharacterized heparinase superfamily protein
MTTITEQLAAALREIRDRSPGSYAHDILAMRSDDWQAASDALAAYDAQPKAFTVFIRDLAGTGTTFITSVVGDVDVEEAKRAAIAECLAEWELPDTPTSRDSLHVLGVAPGDINFIEWTDLES